MQNNDAGITHSEGELGSWKYEQAKGDSSEEENEEAAIQEDAGVLGLIRKLQKTQTEKNRAATGNLIIPVDPLEANIELTHQLRRFDDILLR